MEGEINMFARSRNNDRSSVLQFLKVEDALNDSKMRLPTELEVISPKNDIFAYIKAREEVGFNLLPLFDQEHNQQKLREKYNFGLNDILAIKWSHYQYRYIVSAETPIVPAEPVAMPKAKDVRFERQKVICPSCMAGTCGKRMVAGPNLDETGPLPIPADTLHRYRQKLADIKSRRSRNAFK